MNNNDVERVLMETEDIMPSSGFVVSVMEAVQQEAAAPAPIPFPWKWALPGGVVSVLLTAWLSIHWVYSSPHPSQPAGSAMAIVIPPENVFAALLHVQIAASALVALEWSVLAVLVSLLAAWIPIHFAAGRD